MGGSDRLIRDAIGQTRDLACGLSPVVLQSKGLAVALQELAVSATRQLRLTCECRLPTDAAESVETPELVIHLYRIAQEAVANAAKHGRATRVVISLAMVEGRIELIVEDNGKGLMGDFPQKGEGMGMRVVAIPRRL